VVSGSKKWEMSLVVVTLITLILTPGMIGDERFRVPRTAFSDLLSWLWIKFEIPTLFAAQVFWNSRSHVIYEGLIVRLL